MDAYSRFYKDNKDRLFAYLLRMTGERQSALDLVQESFVRYLERYGNRDGNKPLLYTIARNAALDAVRKKKLEDYGSEDRQDPTGNPEQLVMHQQAWNRTLAAIRRLTPLDRELISLVATADLSYKEIGCILNTSEANIKVRIHRARTKLREILASGGE